MKITITEGCTAFNTEIDGKSVTEHTNEEMDKVYDYLLLKVKEGLNDGTISLDSLINIFQYDDYGHDDHICDQCGDTVGWTTWEI